MKDRIIEAVDTFLHEKVWSNFGKIGPNTIQEAHQIHAGVWMGLVKIWTPRGLYKELKKYDDLTLEKVEKKDLQYRFFVLATSYTIKMVGIALALQIGLDPLAVCGQAVNIG